MTTPRFIESFTSEQLVVCPRCGACARVLPVDSDSSAPGPFTPRRLTCVACGHNRTWEGHRILHTWGSPPVDDYFVLPLWIQIPCCGHVLWAYNWQHLELIAGFVEAEHRKRRRDVDRRWSNRALSSRLPRWMKIASNRQAVLACIRKLQHERR